MPKVPSLLKERMKKAVDLPFSSAPFSTPLLPPPVTSLPSPLPILRPVPMRTGNVAAPTARLPSPPLSPSSPSPSSSSSAASSSGGEEKEEEEEEKAEAKVSFPRQGRFFHITSVFPPIMDLVKRTIPLETLPPFSAMTVERKITMDWIRCFEPNDPAYSDHLVFIAHGFRSRPERGGLDYGLRSTPISFTAVRDALTAYNMLATKKQLINSKHPIVKRIARQYVPVEAYGDGRMLRAFAVDFAFFVVPRGSLERICLL